MKPTKRQYQYLDAILRCDWAKINKYDTLEMRQWVRENKLVKYSNKVGVLPQRLTEKAVDLLV